MAKRQIDYSSFLHVKEADTQNFAIKASADIQELLYDLKKNRKEKQYLN